MSEFDEFDGSWNPKNGENWDPNKRYGKIMSLKDLIHKIVGMEDWLMAEAYHVLINDKEKDLFLF